MYRYGILCLFLFHQLMVTVESQGSYEDNHRLIHDVFEGYHTDILPSEYGSKPVNSTIGMTLLNFKDDFSGEGSLYSNLWLKQTWDDFHLKWTPSAYDGITQFVTPYTKVWRPDVSIYNSYEPQNMNPSSDEGNVIVYSNGMVLFVRHIGVKTVCIEDSTADKQFCELKFGSWARSAAQLDLHNAEDKVKLEYFLGNPRWTIAKTKVTRHETTYACCPESYVDVTFGLWLERKN